MPLQSSLPVQLVAKHSCNLLETLLPRLRYERERESRCCKTEAPGKQACASAQVDDHLGNDDTDDQVCQPDSRSRKTYSLGSLLVSIDAVHPDSLAEP